MTVITDYASSEDETYQALWETYRDHEPNS